MNIFEELFVKLITMFWIVCSFKIVFWIADLVSVIFFKLKIKQ